MMDYNKLLKIALTNLHNRFCSTRIMPTQSIQILHWQTMQMTKHEYDKFKANGQAETIVALDFIVKFKPENIHDNGHYLCIMFQGERVYERKRKHIFDIGFYLARRAFLENYEDLKKYFVSKKITILIERLKG